MRCVLKFMLANAIFLVTNVFIIKFTKFYFYTDQIVFLPLFRKNLNSFYFLKNFVKRN